MRCGRGVGAGAGGAGAGGGGERCGHVGWRGAAGGRACRQDGMQVYMVRYAGRRASDGRFHGARMEMRAKGDWRSLLGNRTCSGVRTGLCSHDFTSGGCMRARRQVTAGVVWNRGLAGGQR